MTRLGSVLVFALAAILAGSLGFYFNSKPNDIQLSEYTLHYQQPRVVSDFSLVDHNGERFSKARFHNQWSLIFLGYTSCPDICPTTLQELNFVYPELSKVSGDKVQVLLVSADPLRDSVERLNQYINYFNKDFIALRGEHDSLFPFTRSIGLMYSIVDDTEQENYLVNHSASIILINPAGNVEAIFKPEHQVGQVLSINSDNLLKDFTAIYQAHTG